jgi:hypothetical protein
MSEDSQTRRQLYNHVENCRADLRRYDKELSTLAVQVEGVKKLRAEREEQLLAWLMHDDWENVE